MEELLAWDSVWSQDLLDLMTRVAEEIEATRDERQYMAVASLFSKGGGQKFMAWIDRIRAKVREAQLEARGVADVSSLEDRFKAVFGSET